MRAPLVRRLSILLLIVAAAGVALAIGSALTAVLALDRDAREMADRTGRLHAALADIQTAQDGFLESGSVTGPLLQETAARLREIEADALRLTSRLRASGTTPEAAALIEAVGALGAAVDRGHDNLRAGRDLMAADLLLSGTEDARRTVERTSRALQAAESAAAGATRTAALVRAWAVFSVAALAGAVLLLLRGRTAAGPGEAPGGLVTAGPESEAAPVPAEADTIVLMPDRAAVADPVFPSPSREETPEPQARPPVDLAVTADLCTAIGRMAAASELPDILTRAAENVRASGIVVWMAVDERLLPVGSHGYDAARLGTLGPVRASDAHATAAAWRSGLTQIVRGTSRTPGAVVVPMHRPDGCVGVLAVELGDGREQDGTTAAVATIVAAQLAAVLSAEPTAAEASTTGRVGLPAAAGS